MPTSLDSPLLGALRCFTVAGRLLNFTKAAAALHLTQSAVSQHIRQLEQRLGYALFVRQARGLQLTPQGAALLDTATRAFHDIEQTLRQLAIPDAPLHVSCLPSFALQWLMPRLSAFHRQQADVAVRLHAEFQQLDPRAMDAGDIDIAIRYDPAHPPGLHTEILLDEYLVVVATPAYLAAHPAFASGHSLDGVTLLHDASPWAGAPAWIESQVWAEAVRPQWRESMNGLQFNLAILAVSAALNHQGAAVSRMALVYDELVSGRLVNVFGQYVRAPARYVLLTRQSADPRITPFIAWLTAECENFAATRQQLLITPHCSAP